MPGRPGPPGSPPQAGRGSAASPRHPRRRPGPHRHACQPRSMGTARQDPRPGSLQLEERRARDGEGRPAGPKLHSELAGLSDFHCSRTAHTTSGERNARLNTRRARACACPDGHAQPSIGRPKESSCCESHSRDCDCAKSHHCPVAHLPRLSGNAHDPSDASRLRVRKARALALRRHGARAAAGECIVAVRGRLGYRGAQVCKTAARG